MSNKRALYMVKRKVKLGILSLIMAVATVAPVFAQAERPTDCPDGISVSVQVNGQNCLNRQTSADDAATNPIIVWLTDVIGFLTIGVGIMAAGGIIYGGILYSSARDNAAQTKQAIDIIRNTIIGLLLYIIMFGAINFVIPGGVLQ